MATLHSAVEAVIEAAAGTTLTGGIYSAEEMDRGNVTLETVQRDGDGRILPFGVLRWRGDIPGGGLHISGRVFLEIWLYEDSGYAHIREARHAIRKALHRRYFTTDDETSVKGRWVGDLGELTADELGGASMDRVRIQFTYAWR